MPPPNPKNLFLQAELLVGNPLSDRSPEDLRRGISTAYYGLFHTVATAAVDMLFGDGDRSTFQYDMAYRTIEHGRLATLCDGKQQTDDLKAFAEAFIQLRKAREDADYSALITASYADAIAKVRAAQVGYDRFEQADPVAKREFLTKLLFKSRRGKA